MTLTQSLSGALAKAMNEAKPKRLTQDELAARSKVSQANISKILRGRISRPGAQTLSALAVALGKSPGYFNKFLLASSEATGAPQRPQAEATQ